MRPKAIFAVLGVLASAALAVGLVGPRFAEADREDRAAVVRAGDAEVGGGVVRAGNAVVDEAGARIEDGPSVDGPVVGENEEDRESTPVGDGEVELRFRGDEGVEFSGTCSTGGEEQKMEGQVPEEFTFGLDGDELECEVRNQGDGTLKMVLISGNSRSVQAVNGDSTMKITFSENGGSSSKSSSSSNGVSQSSSSSVVQSSSSSTGD